MMVYDDSDDVLVGYWSLTFSFDIDIDIQIDKRLNLT